jgi:hypothetical protein
MGRKPRAAAKASAAPDRDIVTNGVRANPVDTRWPKVPPERLISPFVFEAGARYWYSSGSMNFGLPTAIRCSEIRPRRWTGVG